MAKINKEIEMIKSKALVKQEEKKVTTNPAELDFPDQIKN